VRKAMAGHATRLAVVAALAMAAAPATAVAALTPPVSKPAVSTGGAYPVSFGSAILHGSLNPRGSDTSYYFQYGLTKAYGLQTAILDAGAGKAATPVAIAIAGLQPLSVYHYRLVAVNGAGPAIGSDRSFLTSKVPLSLAIFASPNPVAWAGALVVQGTLSGTGNANAPVVLQANPFPYTAGFANVGNPELTSAGGGFSFPLLGLAQSTQLRVVTTTKTPIVSPVALESVAVRVSAHAGPIGPRGRARISGSVTPAEDGMRVGIMRVVHGRNVLSGASVLVHSSARSSRFSVVQHAKRGIYRVFVQVTSGALVSSFSAPFFIK
jgi:hypothetical protein